MAGTQAFADAVAALQSQDPSLSRADAEARVAREQPALYHEHCAQGGWLDWKGEDAARVHQEHSIRGAWIR